MHKVKIFKSMESEIVTLEEEINEWLSESGVQVVQLVGNIAPQTPTSAGIPGATFSSSDVLVIIVYEG
jgi:hypothetical protein